MLELTKEYLRIDGAEDDGFLSFLIDSAKEYLADAGVGERENSKTYELAILMLVTHWYENREQNIVGKTTTAIQHGIQSIVLQLKAGGLPNESRANET